MTDATLTTAMPAAAIRQRLPAAALRRRQFFAHRLGLSGVHRRRDGDARHVPRRLRRVAQGRSAGAAVQLVFDQVNPTAWVAAADLGRQGAGDPWWGGFAPGGKVDVHRDLHRRAGHRDRAAGGAGAAPPARQRHRGGADQALRHRLCAPDAGRGTTDGEMGVTNPETGAAEIWPTRTFTYEIAFDPAKADGGPWIERTPLNLTRRQHSQQLVSRARCPHPLRAPRPRRELGQHHARRPRADLQQLPPRRSPRPPTSRPATASSPAGCGTASSSPSAAW